MGARWRARGGALHVIVRRAATALEEEPSVLAAALAAYRHRHGLDEAALAAWLGLPPERLSPWPSVTALTPPRRTLLSKT